MENFCAEFEETEEFLELLLGDCAAAKDVFDAIECLILLVFREFHSCSVQNKPEVTDSCSVFAFVFHLCEAKGSANSLELRSCLLNFAWVYRRREDKEEVVKVPFNDARVLSVKDPLQCFAEEVEDEGCRSQTKWEEQFLVVFAVPFSFPCHHLHL